MRLRNVEAALIGQFNTASTLEKTVKVSVENTTPLPKTKWKVEIITNTILHTLEIAI